MKSRSFDWCDGVAIAALLLAVLFAGWIPSGVRAATPYQVDVSHTGPGRVHPGSGQYAGPTTFTAIPNAEALTNPQFADWTINGVRGNTDDPLTVNITAPTTLVANFVNGTPYPVTVSTNPAQGGTVDPSSGHYGLDSIFTADPAPGFRFVNWTINGETGNASNPLAIEIRNPATLVSNFTEETLLVSAPVVLDDAYGGWTTGINIRNTSSDFGALETTYDDSSGTVAAIDLHALPGNGSLGVYQGGKLGPNWAGSAVISSTRPVVAAVNEVGPGNRAMGYGVMAQPSSTVYLPLVMDGGYGGWTTGVGIRNTSTLSTTVNIDYYGQDGTKVKMDIGVVEANGYWGVYQGGKFGGNWAGSAVVTSSQPVMAVVNEIGSDGQAIAYNGCSAVGSTVYLPMILKNAYDGWTTGVSIQNASSNQARGTLTYFDLYGHVIRTEGSTGILVERVSLEGRGSVGFYTGSVARLPDGFVGTAVVQTDQPVTVVVNETKPGSDAMGYNGVLQGQMSVDIPVVLDSAYGGWTTGLTIQKAATWNWHYNLIPADVTITYYDQNGMVIGSVTHQLLSPNSAWAVYQGEALGGRAASARITSTQPVAVIVNEIGPGGAAISYNGTQ